MIPSRTHARWGDLVTGNVNLDITSFALKMTLARLRSAVARDDSPSMRQKCIDEVHEFFIRHEELLRNEVKQLFGDSSEAR